MASKTKKSFGQRFGLFFIILVLFGLFYVMNRLTPFFPGDDYLYSFVWTGKGMFDPLPPDAMRITSWGQVIDSLVSHYKTWSGRVMCHGLYFYYAWKGKDLFEICNTLVMVLFLLMLGVFSRRMDKIYRIPWLYLFLGFFGIWVFNPDIIATLFWMGGALNYLWPAFYFLVLSKWYIEEFYYPGSVWFSSGGLYVIFFFGLFVGLTHEALSILVIWFYILLMFHVYNKERMVPDWFLAGFVGLFTGFCFVMFSPGNYSRMLQESAYHLLEFANNVYSSDELTLMNLKNSFYQYILSDKGKWYFRITGELLVSNMAAWWSIYVMEMAAWFYICLIIVKLRNFDLDEWTKLDLKLVKILMSVVFLSYLVFIFLPIVSNRVSFFGLVFLVWAFMITFRVSRYYGVHMFSNALLRKCVSIYCVVVFIASFASAMFAFGQLKAQEIFLVGQAMKLPKNSVFYIDPDWLGVHTYINGLPIPGLCSLMSPLNKSDDNWINVTFARYHNLSRVHIMTAEEKAGIGRHE